MKRNSYMNREGYIFDTPVIARSGIQLYARNGKVVREYRPPAEVFDESSLESFVGQAITIDHPDYMVNSENVGEIVVGTILEKPVRDGNNLRARVVVFDKDAIDLITSGLKSELSVGYTVDRVEKPGITPEGVAYDAVQTNIVCNHLSIVAKGRAGNAMFTTRSFPMQEKIQGDSLPEVDSADTVVEQPAIEAVNIDALNAEIDVLRAEVARLKAEAERAAVIDSDELAKIRGELEQSIRAELKDHAHVLEVARRFGVAECDSADDMRAEVVRKAVPGINLDGKSTDYLRAAFDVLQSTEVKREAPVTVAPAPVMSARQFL